MQAAAPMDTLALLSAPPTPRVSGGKVPSALFHGDLFAYAASSAVMVIDAQRLSTAIPLAGGHRSAAVTAIAWHPGSGPREPRSISSLRLASADEEGRVVVWNVQTGSVIAALDDPLASAFGAKSRSGEARPTVAGLAWATASQSVLAILLSPAVLVLWDYKTGSTLWRKDFGSGETFTSVEVDPLDRRRLVLCGARGTFIVLQLAKPSSDRVGQRQYQVDIGPGGSLRCVFSCTHDLLFLLLQREIIVFDLEYGQPAASTALPASRPPLEDLLASYGHAATGKSLSAGGIDVLYCSHKDGSVSVWQRTARLLTYSLVGSAKLLPPPLKMHTGLAPALVALAAGLWRGLQPQGDEPSAAGPLVTLHLRDGGGRRHPGTVRRKVLVPSEAALPDDQDSSVHGVAPSSPTAAIASGTALASHIGEQAYSVLLMGVGSDGKVWQWQLPLLAGARTEPRAPLPTMPMLQVLGLLHMLSGRVTALSVCSAPVVLPGGNEVVAALAAGTSVGTIEVVPVQQGNLMPLDASISISLSVHKGTVGGLRWLGVGPRLVSYSSEKVTTGYRNTLMLTDAATRVSQSFRKVPVDAAPVSGLRASPSGRYLLVVLRGIPSEIWQMAGPGGGGQPKRLRQVDLQFTAVEWLGPNSMPLDQRQAAAALAGVAEGGLAGPWQPATPPPPGAAPRQTSSESGGGVVPSSPHDIDAPEERLAFALMDGRVGVLAVRGRRIQDTRPRRPSWAPLASGDFRVSALASWAQFVFLGDAEGSLARWDTVTGRCVVVETGQGRVLRIVAAPPPCELLHLNAPAVQARVVVLFASGAFAVYDMDQASELRASHVTPAAAAARAGHAADIEWLPLPVPVGGGSVLAAALADGGLALLDTVHNLDVRPRRMRMLRYRAALHAAPAVGLGGRPAPRLAPPPPLATPGVLPHAWTLLLRVLLQRGLPESVFRELRALAGRSGLEVERVLERLEGEAWACLPRGSQAAWEALARASEAQEAGSLTQFLDSFADTEDDNPGAGPAVVGAAAGMSPALGSAVETSTSLGSPVASSRDAQAAVALGLAGRSGGRARLTGEMRTAIKNLGGAFKDMAKEMAAAGKTQARGQAGMGMRRGAGGSKDGWLRAGWSLNTTRRQPALLQPQLNRLPLHQLRLAGDRGGSSTSSTLRQLGMLPPLSGVSDGAEAPATRSAGYQSLMTVLQAAGAVRGVASVLTQTELAAYNAALSSHRTADRMAVAAHLTGDTEESAFWRRLPATLHWLSAAVHNGGGSGAPGNRHGPSNSGLASGSGGGASGEFVPLSVLAEAGSLLWSDLLERAEAGERSAWHEQMSRRIFENSEELQEKRVLEYVSLGDFQTAVGFLLASPPDRSTRYYRDALCTLGMAFACGLQATAAGSAGGGGAGEQQTLPGAAARVAESAAESAARTLFVQAAKVITANAASVGDTLLGVPLLCSTGQHADAANLLQDAGLWYYASALTAHSLCGHERAAALERWAGQVAWAEGRPWAAAGVLVAAGALKSAATLFRQAGLPDAAAALVAACKEGDVPLTQAALESGELANLFSGGQPAVQRYNSAGERLEEGAAGSTGWGAAPQGSEGGEGVPAQHNTSSECSESNETAKEFQLYVCEVLCQL